MRIRPLVLLVIIATDAVASGQSPLPAGIHPQSLSRLPPVQRADLDEEGKRIWDALSDANKAIPRTGPSAVTMHSPKAAEPIYALNQYLRKTVAGVRYFEVAALVAAREFDQQYEWSGHEPAAVRAGVEQSIIDVIKFNRGVAGVPEKDATVIQLGRALFRDLVSPELWTKMEQLFGRQGAVELTIVMADYAMAGFVIPRSISSCQPIASRCCRRGAATRNREGRNASGNWKSKPASRRRRDTQYRPNSASSGSVRSSGAAAQTIQLTAGRPTGIRSARRSSRMNSALDTGFGAVAT